MNQTAELNYQFRKYKVKKPSQRRINRVKDKPLAKFPGALSYFTIPFLPFSFKPFFSFLGRMLRSFIFMQYFEKWHILHIPVKHVDHKLDEKVPFRTELLGIYMDFINYWTKPLIMLCRRYGFIKGSKLCGEYLNYLSLTYKESYKMYSYSLTTTYRPFTTDKKIKKMRKADPHYLCVPSLHIAIICLTFSFYKMLFDREDFTEEEKTKWNKEFYDHGIEIAETVLYVKQHSVNCIPAAIYMITKIAPELFTTDEGVNFINELFKNATDITAQDKKDIIDHIQYIYERFYLEGIHEDDWVIPVRRWLDGNTNDIPSYAATADNRDF